MNSETKLDLTRISDVDLLQSIVDITLRNKDLTQTDRDDLEAINQEFQRRDSLKPRRQR